VVLPQVGVDWDELLEAARHAESAGADSVWVIDHLFGFPPTAGILEAWTVMSALAAATTRVEIGAQVHCQSFRNPALLAKMASTLDRVSNGRLRVLVGAGWYQAEYDAFGYDFPAPGVLIEQLRETITILKALTSPHERFTFDGRHYRTKDATNLPLPVQQPLPIEVGGARDRLLRTVAKMGDGWNCPGIALSMLDDRLAFLGKALADAGRSLRDLRLSCQIVAAVGDDEAMQDPRLAMFNPSLGLVGSVDQVAARARELVDKGVGDFNCIVPPGERGRAVVERLVGEVKPRV
jgi:alkanesulfonate monooxygenase SsuD/methylene tetrahydromethanopterin reductase-like flavin-dependent oxidoreductase (luciferase family)